MYRFLKILAGATALMLLGSASAEDALDLKIRNGWAVAKHQDALIANRPVKNMYPKVTTTDAAQAWVYGNSSVWTSGFFPASLWLLHQQFPLGGWSLAARDWQAGMEAEKTNTGTQDLGLMVFLPFVQAYRLTGNDAYRQIILTAADTLAQRYSPIVGAIRSWGSDSTNYKVVIDVMMDIEVLFWAAQHGGDPVLHKIARQHALTTLKHHLRADGGSFHRVTFNPLTGAVKSRTTVQGYSDSSTWARGQAWAIYGFAMTYRYTKEAIFRDTARKMAEWYLAHLPAADWVPFWDFNDPAIPNAPRDSSSAVVTAAGLFELAWIETDAARASKYRLAAKKMLAAALSPPYLTQLIPGKTTYNSEALLLWSAYNHNNNKDQYNQGSSWGDYYLLEAMMRYRRDPPGLPALPVAGISASSAQAGFPPIYATDNNLATRWSAFGDGQSITIDLGKNTLVQKVGLAFLNGNQRCSRFDVATFDGVAWATRFRGFSSCQTNALEFFDIPDATVRLVRVIGHGTTVNLWNSITEFKVF